MLGSIGLTSLVVLRQLLVQSETAEAAETDGLTGLANRSRLHDELAHALQRASRTGDTVAVLLIDLNGFKQINDTLGHRAGDGLLVAVAEAMRHSVRQDDLVGRLGGDEFAVLLRTAGDESAAGAVAQRIGAAIAR
ncbi:GGDEF domain-containing protein [Actinoplanes sp. TRM 88003]|uniref:GGDEF domain-containing protein n=1 Tax=Paractinoplanes aksuensis TaxID=2939490 RepID=A0ABT1DJS8_9ACTN|nr:diguanylate cyclase [Actinoplanes aksuensis]MCO8271097.1 GGDEF domain-containing protein [Actinoplanes aksuensis]